MNYKRLGRTGLEVSALGFGCGMIGGLLVRGEYPTMRRTVARAIELGITYFDTAPLYGEGQSEVNLGAIQKVIDAGKLDAFIQAVDRTAILETVRTGTSGIGRGERILRV